jgi:hypothetical protein
VTRLRRTTRLRAHVSSASRGTEQASASREATARGTGAVADGGEGVGGLQTSGDVGERPGKLDPAEHRRPVVR